MLCFGLSLKLTISSANLHERSSSSWLRLPKTTDKIAPLNQDHQLMMKIRMDASECVIMRSPKHSGQREYHGVPSPLPLA